MVGHVRVVQVRYMDFVIVGEDALLEDRNINVNNSAVVFKNNRVRATDFVSLFCGVTCGHCLSLPYFSVGDGAVARDTILMVMLSF